MEVRVGYAYETEIVAIVDAAGCKHLFVMVRMAYGYNSKSGALFDGGCTHCFVVGRIAYGDDSYRVVICGKRLHPFFVLITARYCDKKISVAISDGGCTHLFLVAGVAHCYHSEGVAIVDGCVRILCRRLSCFW